MASLLPVFEWCENTAVGNAIRGSLWLFPVVESFHLLALALIGGAVLVVDLRLLGLGLRRQPVAQLARDAQPWLAGGLVVMVVSGILLFLSEAVKCYYSAAFMTKMTFLFPAIVFTFTVRRRVAAADDDASAAALEETGGPGLSHSVDRRRRLRTLDRVFGVVFEVYRFGSVGSRPSFGAPVPDEPKKSFRPSGNVRSRPLAFIDPSLA